jgi:hypothetical protein
MRQYGSVRGQMRVQRGDDLRSPKQNPGVTAGVLRLQDCFFRSAPEQRQQKDDRQRDSD